MQGIVFALISGLVLSACQRSTPSPMASAKGAEVSAPADNASTRVHVYPRGRWRDHAEVMDDYYASLAHVFISHNQSDMSVLASYWPWTGDWQSNPRTRDEALKLVNELSRSLRANETTFETVAATWSEDPITRSYGGHYGVMRAPNYLMELLDAHEALSDGEISLPFETQAGYHLVKRVRIPAEQHTWSRRLIVMYEPVAGWVRKGRTVTRTREEARTLAAELSRRAREKPDDFASLIEQYSDDVTADVAGEAGPSSNLSGKLDVAARFTLARLGAMEISEPLDELLGFTIIQRLPARVLEERAFDMFVIATDGERGGVPVQRSADEARSLAEQLARNLRAHPSQFAAAKAQFCAEERCAGEGPFITDGSEYPTIYKGLAELAPGEVSIKPEQCPVGMVVYQRLALPETPTTPPRIFRFEVAEPAQRALD